MASLTTIDARAFCVADNWCRAPDVGRSVEELCQRDVQFNILAKLARSGQDRLSTVSEIADNMAADDLRF